MTAPDPIRVDYLTHTEALMHLLATHCGLLKPADTWRAAEQWDGPIELRIEPTDWMHFGRSLGDRLWADKRTTTNDGRAALDMSFVHPSGQTALVVADARVSRVEGTQWDRCGELWTVGPEPRRLWRGKWG